MPLSSWRPSEKEFCTRAVQCIVSWPCYVGTSSSMVECLAEPEPHRFSTTWVVLHLGGPACWGWWWCWWCWRRWSSMWTGCILSFSNCCLTSLGLWFFICKTGALDIRVIGELSENTDVESLGQGRHSKIDYIYFFKICSRKPSSSQVCFQRV